MLFRSDTLASFTFWGWQAVIVGAIITPSLVSVMKQAGYKTFWVTNQQTMTKRNTMLTTFSEQADEQVYLNNNRNQNARQYDGDVLAPFSKALADPAERKFIVVHLLGTHMSYQYRYPPTFDKFVDRTGVPAGLNDAFEVVNIEEHHGQLAGIGSAFNELFSK